MNVAIETHGLTKHYGDFPALKNLDLEVRPGEVFGFLGPNGAGKTTMIRTILDEIRPTAGSASIVGLDTHRDAVEIRNHIGYLPGDLAMYPRLTGRDTITYFANLRGGVDWSYVDELAERLDADLSKKVGDLSTGNRQKVGLIQAFMNRPDAPSSSPATPCPRFSGSPTGSASFVTATSLRSRPSRTCARRRCAESNSSSPATSTRPSSTTSPASATCRPTITASCCPTTERWIHS